MSFGSLPSVLGNGGGVAISVIGGTGLFAAGTAAAPSISFASDTDTGFWLDSSGLVRFTSNGTASFGFGGGYFTNGIGTSYLFLPNTGSISVVAAGANQNITLTPSGTGNVVLGASGGAILAASGTSYYGFTDASGYGMSYQGIGLTLSAGILIFKTNLATEGMRILLNQRVLLGTTADSGARLQLGINTDTTAAGGIVFGTDCNIYRLGTNTAGLAAGGNTTLFWDANNFGGGAQVTGVATISRSGISAASPGYSFYNNNSTGMFSDAASTIKFSTAGVTALTLDASQNATFAGVASVYGINMTNGDNTKGFLQGIEIADAPAPAANTGRLYFRDNGGGKTQLVVRFNTGAVQVVATEP